MACSGRATALSKALNFLPEIVTSTARPCQGPGVQGGHRKARRSPFLARPATKSLRQGLDPSYSPARLRFRMHRALSAPAAPPGFAVDFDDPETSVLTNHPLPDAEIVCTRST